jgi:hypothetical protein
MTAALSITPLAMLSAETINKLQCIIKEETGRDLTLREASEIANGLVGYFDLLAKIDFENKIENAESKPATT